ncbi:excisionase family DNA-binding protein [Mycolicibacterium smegmatis]|uniref:excisionase family DNA-binding protein n=1 Tax=Mycolicibacterium smegmatis TaxID=1772 RepID=UPI0020A57BFE|nr:helix-turn-helix domain-containing protein [Mycolicibacterium smegmatis]MCP2622056.1 excisionase family DNA-binding protein [Mycolicibacterium smegmatis]
MNPNPDREAAAAGLRARIRREEAALHAEGYVTIDDAAALLNMHRDTVTRMIVDGRLRATRIEDRTVTRQEWIDAVPRSRKDAALWRREHGWLSVAEAAAGLGITRQALNVRISKGTQPAVRAGAGTPTPGAWLIRAGDVQRRAA